MVTMNLYSYDLNIMVKHHFHIAIMKNVAALTIHKDQVQYIKMILSMQIKDKPLFTLLK